MWSYLQGMQCNSRKIFFWNGTWIGHLKMSTLSYVGFVKNQKQQYLNIELKMIGVF